MRRFQHEGPCTGGVQVVVEDPDGGGVAFGLRVVIAGLGGGVGAEQVMEGKPARGVLGGQVRAGQLAQQPAGLRLACSGEAGDGWGRYVGAGVQAQQSEHARRSGAELVVGPGEYCADAGRRVAGIQGVQPPGRVAQFGGQARQREGGPGGGAGRGDRQRQRQQRAQAGDLGDRVRLGGDAASAEAGGEQLDGFVVGEGVEAEQPGAARRRARRAGCGW